MIVRLAALVVLVAVAICVAVRERRAERARIAVRSFDEQWAELHAAVDDLGREMARAFLPAMREMARAFGKLGSTFAMAADSIRSFAEALDTDEEEQS